MRLDRDVRGQSRWAVVVGLNLLAALRKKESALLPSPPTHKRNAGLERERQKIKPTVSWPPLYDRFPRPECEKDGRISGEICSGGEYSQKNWKEECGLLPITPPLLVNSLFQTSTVNREIPFLGLLASRGLFVEGFC